MKLITWDQDLPVWTRVFKHWEIQRSSKINFRRKLILLIRRITGWSKILMTRASGLWIWTEIYMKEISLLNNNRRELKRLDRNKKSGEAYSRISSMILNRRKRSLNKRRGRIRQLLKRSELSCWQRSNKEMAWEKG